MKNPFVSVLINTKNRPKLLHRAIKSILIQTYKNFELIIADASTNNCSRDVVELFEDKRIKYIKIEDEINFSSTLNFSYNQCQGKYIAIQDDDDESYPERLEKQIELFEKSPNNVGVIYCWEEFFNDELKEVERISKPNLRGNIYLDLVEKAGGTGGGTQLVFRKDAFDNSGGYNEEVVASDYLLYLNMSKKYEFDFVPEVLIRTHLNHIYSRTSDFLSEDPSGINKSIELIKKILEEHSNIFKIYPKKKYYHYKTLMKCYAKTGNLKKYFYYLISILRIKPFAIGSIKSSVKGFYLLVKSLLFL